MHDRWGVPRVSFTYLRVSVSNPSTLEDAIPSSSRLLPPFSCLLYTKMNKLAALLCLLFVASTHAFVPAPRMTFGASARSTVGFSAPLEPKLPAALQRQRKSMASVQTMGLFGLGPAEIAIILVAAAFLLGPQKLAELGKDAGKVAGELKEVPKEFQKGLAEGEQEAAKMKKELQGADAEVVKDDSDKA